jgi:hypothetical protein
MNDQTQTLIRSVLKIGGGYLMAKGLADSNQVETIGAGIFAALAILWGYLHRTPTAPSSGKANGPKSGALLALGLAGCLAFSGCQAGRAGYNTLGTLGHSTITAYDAYCDLVIAGQVKTNDVPAVSQKFNTFLRVYSAALATQGTNGPATAEAIAASTEVTTAINSAK